MAVWGNFSSAGIAGDVEIAQLLGRGFGEIVVEEAAWNAFLVAATPQQDRQ